MHFLLNITDNIFLEIKYKVTFSMPTTNLAFVAFRFATWMCIDVPLAVAR